MYGLEIAALTMRQERQLKVAGIIGFFGVKGQTEHIRWILKVDRFGQKVGMVLSCDTVKREDEKHKYAGDVVVKKTRNTK